MTNSGKDLTYYSSSWLNTRESAGRVQQLNELVLLAAGTYGVDSRPDESNDVSNTQMVVLLAEQLMSTLLQSACFLRRC